MTTAGSQMGAFYVAHFDAAKAYKGTGNSDASHGWEYRSHDAYADKWDYMLKFGPSSVNVAAPDWLPTIVITLVGGAPWMRSPPRSIRFSLRTLLIVTTLVAVVLGLAVWVMR
jgi:hypothetical protein